MERENKELYDFVAKKISALRLGKKISARKLSIELGQSPEYINQIENKRALPSLCSLSNLCFYFGISISDFFEKNITYPVEYKEIIRDLNKLDKIELEQIANIIKMISINKTYQMQKAN